MKYKIIGIVICILMIVPAFPVVGFPLQTPIVHEHPEKTSATMDDIVISMLEQVDETMYLRYLEDLISFSPRITGTDACNATAVYIYNQFENMGLPVRYQHWENRGYSSDNVEATIHGTDESSDDIYIICAHYDTVDCLGADDDTSGTIAVLMAAFIMSQSHYKFNYTIKFVAFSGEEEGLLGSYIYVNEAVAEGWNIVGVLNADMISYAVTKTQGDDLIVYCNDASEWLYNYTLDINTEYVDYIHLILHNGGLSSGSDHYYFWKKGYDAIYYEEYHFNPYWHEPEDTIANINTTYAVKTVRLMLATLAELSEVEFNNIPNAPTIAGETNGDIRTTYDYAIQATDPDVDNIIYFIDWGDNTNTSTGWNVSGVEVIIPHTWDLEGNYSIKVKAIDQHGAESEWATLSVTMPLSFDKPISQLFERLFQRFPNAFLLLRQLMGC